MKRPLLPILTLLLALFLLLPVGCGEKKSIVTEPVVRPVRVIKVEEAGARGKQTLAGVAHASQEMSLSFRVSGTLNTLKVRLGDEVKKGDLIASLDTKDASIEIERAKASVARANAEYRSAQADFERTKSLYAEGSGSRSELDAARALADSTNALLSAENKNLKMTYSKLADHRLTAPLSGAIAEVDVEVNENVQSGQAIALLNAGDKAEVKLAVPESLIQFFRKGTPATARFDSIKGVEYAGVVSEVGVSSKKGAIGFPVTVALLKADPRVRAGMSVLVSLDLLRAGDIQRIFVPPSAVMEDSQSQAYVFVAKPTEKGFAIVERIDVTLGEPSSNGMHIEAGVTGGELLIVAGLSQVTDGMKVRLLSADEPALASKRLKGAEALKP